MRVGNDAGHGGIDPGAIGSTGLREKDITLAISLELTKELIRNDFQVTTTRTKDITVELNARDDVFDNAKCDIGISIHVNSSTDKAADYISTWIYKKGGKAEIFGVMVQRRLVQVTGWEDGGVREKNLAMVRETNMPTVLVELGFISNPLQEKWLKNPENQKKLAQSITMGICDFTGKPYKNISVPSLIGRKIETEYDLYVGENKLAKKAIVIDGVSYSPVRLLAESLNKTVKFDGNKKRIDII